MSISGGSAGGSCGDGDDGAVDAFLTKEEGDNKGE